MPNIFRSQRTTAITTTPLRIPFDLALHGDEAVDEPKQHTDYG